MTMLCHYTECHYAECQILFIVMLNVIIQSVVMLNVMAPKFPLLAFDSFSPSLWQNKLEHFENIFLPYYWFGQISWSVWICLIFRIALQSGWIFYTHHILETPISSPKSCFICSGKKYLRYLSQRHIFCEQLK